MNYRREIDGLRALAVIPVILYHAGLQGFSGGYVGVDIFFVISGFLITAILLSEMQTGTFSLIGFYERRARRILPALFLVLLVCLPFAWFWLQPLALANFSESLVAVTLFISNVFFWKHGGYFDIESELNPLLHTWSLAVEEQYYLVFPLFLMLAWRFGKKWMVGLLLLGSVASLALAYKGSLTFSTTAFYLLPGRGWELLVGAFTAFYLSSKKVEINTNQPLINQLLGILGLALIVYSIVFFNKDTPFPGLYTLAPTIGAALIILYSSQQTIVGKLLGSKAFVGIGLISYSAYLWHQPLFSFAKHRSYGAPSQPLLITLSIASLVLAYFSWKYVETPFRDKNRVKRKQIFTFAAIGSLLFIAIGAVGSLKEGFPNRYIVPKALSDSFGVSTKANECFDKPGVHTRADWLCDLGVKQPEKPTFMMFGDSHSRSMFDAFDAAATNQSQHGNFTGTYNCTPLLGIHVLRRGQAESDCNALNTRVYEYVKANKIPNLFLVSRWTYYTDGGYDGTDATWIGLSKNSPRSKQTSRAAFEAGLKSTVEAYNSIGTQVHLVEQVPLQKLQVQEAYYNLYADDKNKVAQHIRQLSVSTAEHQQLQAYVNTLFKGYEQKGQVKLINFDDVLCNHDKCSIGTEAISNYSDNNHLTTDGDRLLVNKLMKSFN